MPTTIYALCEPDLHVPVIRYIGKTVTLFKRFKAHLSQTVKEQTRVGNWLKSLAARGEKPVLMTLDTVSDDQGAAAEVLYIRLARDGGMDLCNLTDGGDGVVNPSPESREKVRQGKLGRRNPNFGRVPQVTQDAALRANLGRVPTLEVREILRATKLGPLNPNFGKCAPVQVRALMSAGQKEAWVLRRMPCFSDGGGI